MCFIWEDEEKEVHVLEEEDSGEEYMITFDEDFDRIKYYSLIEI